MDEQNEQLAKFTADIKSSLKSIKGMILTFVMRLDYVRASYWIGVAIGADYMVPQVIQLEIMGATYRQPDHKALIKALDEWVV